MSVTINGTTGINNSGSDSASGGYTGTLTGNASTASAPANGSTLALQSAKAWVNFNGTLTGTISPRSSYNVSSVTKNGSGNYTVNFSTAMADANFCSLATSYYSASYPSGYIANEVSRGATYVQITLTNTQNTGDVPFINVAVFGN